MRDEILRRITNKKFTREVYIESGNHEYEARTIANFPIYSAILFLEPSI